MEVTGKIIAVMPMRGGMSSRTGQEWYVQDYVIEVPDEAFTRKIAFEVFGADRIANFAIQEGEELTVSFDIDAAEYNGHWYNRLRAWKVQR